jgi:hypothetical protein
VLFIIQEGNDMAKNKIQKNIEDEYNTFLKDFSARDYNSIFNRLCVGTDNFQGRCFAAYMRCHKHLIDQFENDLLKFQSGCFPTENLFTRDDKPITKESSRDDILNAIRWRFDYEELKLDSFYLHYIYKHQKFYFLIKDFPAGTKDEDKKTLNEIVYHHLIDIDLQPNGKYKMIENPNPERNNLRPIIAIILDHIQMDNKDISKDIKWENTRRKANLFLKKYIDVDFANSKTKENARKYISDLYKELKQ